MEVSVRLPKGVRAKDLAVTIKYNLVKFALKNGHSMDEEEGAAGGETGSTTLLQRLLAGLRLYQKIDSDCSTWSLDDGQLVVSLAKRQARDWPALYE